MDLHRENQDAEEMKWKVMPENDAELEKMIKKAQNDFDKGKGLSTNQVREIVRSWK